MNNKCRQCGGPFAEKANGYVCGNCLNGRQVTAEQKQGLRDQAGMSPDTKRECVPVTMMVAHNTEKSPFLGATYGQDIEPAGRYVIQVPKPVPGWENATVTFDAPLHIDFGGQYGDPSNWKQVLSDEYDCKTGVDLSRALVDDGYDAIITSDSYGTSEIIDLYSFVADDPNAMRPPADP